MSCCEACGCLSVCPRMLQNFQVYVCFNCAQTCPEYKLISKGAAKSTYLVTDNDLKKLSFIKKANPHKPQWADMMLFLTSQVAAIAGSKHGDVRGAQHTRMEERIRSRLGKRSAEQQEEEERQGCNTSDTPRQLNLSQERVRKRILSEYGQQQQQKLQQSEPNQPIEDVDTEEI